MRFIADTYKKTAQVDVWILPFFQAKKGADKAFTSKEDFSFPPLVSKDFTGEKGKTLFFYFEKTRILLLGLGEEKECDVEKLRIAIAGAVKKCREKKLENVGIFLPKGKSFSREEAIRGFSEGLCLANYSFDKLKHEEKKKEALPLLTEALWVDLSKKELEIASYYLRIAKTVHDMRDLVNDNADTVTPERLAHVAKELGKGSSHVKTTVFGLDRIKKEKLGLIEAVNRSSAIEPKLIFIEYKGNPSSKETIALVGKGITYDTGGLSLKPTSNMETMKADMGGAAVILGVMQLAIECKIKKNLIGVIAASENMIGSKSYKIGDVYTSYSGRTVEISNTDAEGRLVLADAIAYTVKNYKPSCLVDVATLTGGVVVALGEQIAGLFTNRDTLAKELEKASHTTGEKIWRLPIAREYKELLKSDFADCKNSGQRQAHPIQPVVFLEDFVGDIPWVHLDIAGPAFLDKTRGYFPTRGTGFGVRLFFEWLCQ